MSEGYPSDIAPVADPQPQQPWSRTHGATASRGMLWAGAVLTAVGLMVWLLSGLQSHREARSFADGGPPRYVAITAEHTYSIDASGGAKVPEGTTIDPDGLRCTIAGRGEGPSPLSVIVETNPKAVNQLGQFTAPYSGDVHLACTGFADIYVDDADGSYDLAGLLILLAVIALTIGVPLLLSGVATALKQTPRGRAVGGSGAARRAAPLDNRGQDDKSRPLPG